jgi:hypothetical protein
MRKLSLPQLTRELEAPASSHHNPRSDATELGYKVIMISDALSGHAHGLHEATLATFYRIFGDVRPSGEVIKLLSG